MKPQRLALALVALLPVMPAAAQPLSPAIRTAAVCAPVGTPAPSKPLLIRARPAERRSTFNAGDRIAIEGGHTAGLQAGQRFFVRRPMRFHGAPRAQLTAGWLHIVEITQAMAIAEIDFACDAVAVGDHLEPYVEPALPPRIDRTDATGTLDFSRTGQVLYANDGRVTAGGRDFVLANMGQMQGVTPGARYAVYRHAKPAEDPTNVIAEAVVVSVFPDKSLLRLTDARDVVTLDDTVVLRVGGTGGVSEAAAGRSSGAAEAGVAREPARPAQQVREDSLRVPREQPRPEPQRRVEFEDVYFDFDRQTLRPEALPRLDGVLKVLRDDPTLRVQIEGHTCNIGTAEYNLALGERRAKAVRDYLVGHGIAEPRLTTVTFGEEQPKHDNARRETRRLNRRAALVVNIQR